MNNEKTLKELIKEFDGDVEFIKSIFAEERSLKPQDRERLKITWDKYKAISEQARRESP